MCRKKNEIKKDNRKYSCSCGYSLDRDYHAAINMLAFALKKIPVDCREYKLVERKLDTIKSAFLNEARSPVL